MLGSMISKIFGSKSNKDIKALMPKVQEINSIYNTLSSMTDDELMGPDKADSTELGEVPQAVKQGSIRKGYIRDPYAMNYLYTLE